MGKKAKKARNSRDAPKQGGGKASFISLSSPDAFRLLCGNGYKPLGSCPEIQMAVNAYADTIASMTIHLMQNTEAGDIRIRNELSRRMDIDPNPDMTRYQLIHDIVHTLMLEGGGNQVTIPIYRDGYLEALEPVPPSRVTILPPQNGGRYSLMIGGTPVHQDEVLHFVLNPDPEAPYRGRGYAASLTDIAAGLRQAGETKRALMENPNPSLIIKVDGYSDELQTPEKRRNLAAQYMGEVESGKPWLVQADTFDVQRIEPLTLNDLAIRDSLELDRKSAAAMLRVPAFMVGAGVFDAAEFDWFVSVPCMAIAKIIEQELTRKTLIAPDWYWRFNNRSLLNYNFEKLVNAGKELVDRASMRRNEWRDMLGMSPDPEMDDVLILENYLRKNKNDMSDAEGGEEDA